MPSIRGHVSESSLVSETNSDDDEEVVKRTPLPWSQLSVAYLIDISEAIAATVIYPFISQLVQETGITEGDQRKAGYFTGIILSASAFAEIFSVVPIGTAADRFGRRPFLLIGPLGLALLILAFGMSTQFWLLVALRALQGIFSANIIVVKAVVGEITDSTNIEDAFSYLPVCWLVGYTIGPLIGGLLSHPKMQWPGSYLQLHPYFLPCLVTSLCLITVFLVAAMTLKETLPSALARQKRKSAGSSRSADPESSPLFGWDLRQQASQEQNLKNILKLPDLRIILINIAFYYICSNSLDTLIPLMWPASIELGGLGWSTSRIGVIMGARSTVDALVQIAILGTLLRKFGARKLCIWSFSSFSVSFLSFPVANFAARQASGSDWKVLLIVVSSLLVQCMRLGAYAALMILVTRSAPSQSSLATMIGIAQAVSAIMRFIAPAFASSLYSLSLQHQLAEGNAVYYILALIAACGIRFSLLLPEHVHLKRPVSSSSA